MNTIKYAQSTIQLRGSVKNKIVIIVDSMNRFIYESDEKIFSIRSPFNVRNDQGALKFYTKNIEDIDSQISSKVISLINDDRFESSSLFGFYEIIEEHFSEPDNFWPFIHELMLFEDGYIRYDHDTDNENGRLHPLYHLDVCYTTASTFKIGTYQKPCINYLIQLLDNNTEAKYLEMPKKK